ncbi:hypothetical protein [Kurthia massiliensis]|uniref:hypothetical protein n=1 Tax=Kurthia massiliensis TaxID=1033739 RepID=UPI000288F421|nr:hypothetical protein [Kurthia massiliensis]
MKKALLATAITLMCIAVFIVMPYCLLKSSLKENGAVHYKNIEMMTKSTNDTHFTAWLPSNP